MAEQIKKRKEKLEEQSDSDDIKSALDDAIGLDDDEPAHNVTNEEQREADGVQ